MRISGLVMAAGKSSRMGFRKLSAELAPGVPLGSAALGAAAECGLEPLHVVVRPDDPLLWLPQSGRASYAGDRVPDLSAYKAVPSPEAERGLSYSLRAGLRSLEAVRPDAVLVALADQPLVDASWLKGLIRVYIEGADIGLEYTASRSGETVMPPAVMSWKVCAAALERLTGDRGAGMLFASGEFQGETVSPEETDMLFDVDTPEDLERVRMLWHSRFSR